MPNYETAKMEAYNLILNLNLVKFPIDVKGVIEKLKKDFKIPIVIKKYSLLPDELKIGSNKGFTFFNGKGYIICYNEKDTPQSIRWTLAHELGHILMYHFKQKKVDDILYFDETLDDNNYFEKEANCFAKYLLIPYPAYLMHKEKSIIELAKIFDISYQALEYTLNHYDKLCFKTPIENQIFLKLNIGEL